MRRRARQRVARAQRIGATTKTRFLICLELASLQKSKLARFDLRFVGVIGEARLLRFVCGVAVSKSSCDRSRSFVTLSARLLSAFVAAEELESKRRATQISAS